MKTKTLMAITLAGVLSSSLFAVNGINNDGDENLKKNFKKDTKSGYHKKRDSFLSLLKKLNLSVEQKNKIFEIRKETMKNNQTLDIAFSKTSFDKEKFIEIMKQKRDNMIESKAEMIGKVYAVLTSEQKEQLKVLMDLKKQRKMAMMDRRINFDKNCNGRR